MQDGKDGTGNGGDGSDVPIPLEPVVLPAQDQPPQRKKHPGGRPPGVPESRHVAEGRRKRKALSLFMQGCDLPTVRAATGVAERSLKAYKKELRTVFKELDTVGHFRRNKVDILDAAMAGVLKSMGSQEKLEKASLNNAAYAAMQLYQMHRLETGQSTANVSTFVRIDIPKVSS